MPAGKRGFIIALVIIGIIIIGTYGFLKGTYNNFVAKDESVKNAWAQV
jgi:hypothetical protein